MRLPTARSLLVIALLVAGLANVHAMVLSVRAHARFRESAFATVRARVTGVRSALGQRIALGGGYDRDAALRQALAEGVWDSIEAFAPDGRHLAALPAPSSVRHWVTAVELESLRAGAVLVGVEPLRRSDRILAYALVAGPDEQAVVRFITTSPELAAESEERDQIFLGHAATLVVLLLVAGIVIAPRTAGGDEAPPRALIAYEEAMERLRDHGEEQSVRHEAERRQMEEVLRDKEAMARAGELTAGIVHEVRNGLGTVAGYARLIERTSPDAADSARGIREECETLEAVIRRFVDFVRRETLALAPVDVARLLERVVARESQRPGPPVDADAVAAGTITADETLLERAFENLVRNAREAAGPDGHVWVTAARQGASAVVTVADDGPGFASGMKAALRPFFTTKAGGLGLGLAITLKIVGLHDGELQFGQRSPRGTAVSVRLPVAGPRGGSIVTEGSIGARSQVGPADA
jgi:signal transduction histidine kinase